jgi:4-methyl-5(b-hydroxyethyl)-thiazole monophosphate biosynthesis
MVAEKRIAECTDTAYDLIVLPGGMPGASNLAANSDLSTMLKHQHSQKKYIAAICAAPAVVLAPLGILDGIKAVCYPAPKFESAIPNLDTSAKNLLVVEDGHVITSKGPGTAMVRTIVIERYDVC